MYSESRIPRKYRLAPDIEITTLEARIPIRQMVRPRRTRSTVATTECSVDLDD